jgi:hypothetical protein
MVSPAFTDSVPLFEIKRSAVWPLAENAHKATTNEMRMPWQRRMAL